MKKILLGLIVLAVVVATVPLWGSCDLNQRLCNATCTVRHLDSDAKRAGCRTRCAADSAACLAEAGAESVRKFMEGLQR